MVCGRSPKRTGVRAEGLPIISTWIDECEDGQTTSWSQLYERCIREASVCAAFVLYVPMGDEPRGGAYMEMGAALAGHVPVYAFAPGAPKHLLAHPGVVLCDSLQSALQWAKHKTMTDQEAL